jgi:hypothetical protein
VPEPGTLVLALFAAIAPLLYKGRGR